MGNEVMVTLSLSEYNKLVHKANENQTKVMAYLHKISAGLSTTPDHATHNATYLLAVINRIAEDVKGNPEILAKEPK